jgi:6-phosphogluconolactonase
LRLVERIPSGGRTPRHFAIDPAGRWLLVANQDSNDITLFRIDRRSGRLTAADRPLTVASPVCVLIVPSE